MDKFCCVDLLKESDVVCRSAAGTAGTAYNDIQKGTEHLRIENYLNNTFNLLTWSDTQLTPYSDMLFDFSLEFDFIFCVYALNAGDLEDYNFYGFDEDRKLKNFHTLKQSHPDKFFFAEIDYELTTDQWPSNHLYVVGISKDAPSYYSLYFAPSSDGQSNEANLVAILGGTHSIEFPYCHEISSTRQSNFNGATFTAQSGAIKKYQLGKPEIIHDLNYKIENLTQYEQFKKLQTEHARTGRTVILKENSTILFLSDATLNANQIANLVWNITINGKEKV